ncbi:Flagellar M-ring protein [bacterium HR19]|nr:Flagellar M-ring protein [bacterium HR19]
MRAQDILKQIGESVRRIPLPVLIGIAAIFLISGIGIFIYQITASKKQEIKWDVLYTDLKSQDVSRIIDELERMKIPYKLSDTADTIFVPKELVPDIRNTLATKGLPQERAGLEIFEKPKFGLTEFMQRVNYQRAIQNELERTIMKINCVENARVHIVIPEKKLFTEEQKEPTASVMLWLTPGCSISPASVKGIIHLVSFAVEGLKPENVSVVDQRGRILNPKKEDEGLTAVEATQGQLELERQFERNLEDKLTELLEKSVGAGKVAVKVDADLDFTKVKRVSERYDPAETAVRSEQTIEERFKGVGAVPVGPPGTRQNVPPEIGIEPLPGKSEYERNERIRNYEISKIVEHVEEEVGDLKRISVAVMVDGQYEVEWRDGKPFIRFIPLPDDELEKIRSFVESAVGIVPARGDQISVVSVPFEGSLRYAERLAMLQLSEVSKERASMYKWLAIAAIGFFISLYLIFKKLFERRLPQEVEVVIPKFEKAPPEKVEVPVIVEVQPPPPPPEIAITPPEVKVEEIVPPPAFIEVTPPPVPQIVITPPPPPPPEEVAPPPPPPRIEEVAPPPPPPPEEVVVEEIVPPPEEFAPPPPPPPKEEIELPKIEIAPPPLIQIPEIEVAPPPAIPEEEIERAVEIAKDVIRTNKDLVLNLIRRWLSER